MTSVVHNVAFDCPDPYRLALFWSEVTGQPLDEEDVPGGDEAQIRLPSGMHLFFQQVPETKAGKNRVHVCLRPEHGTRDEEVARLLAVGATMVSDHREPDGTGWAVLGDPECNEFCVLRGAAERAKTDRPNVTFGQ
ncbi:VOC family protein [Amycolatopsis nigrescens]|uniref:VOC family protein n=1 Tax=Amycolatopsis nigrescens TaxID=381445 RepID=UPI0003609D09|nr:VOC family protein [Amycolatopsis nigrescens]